MHNLKHILSLTRGHNRYLRDRVDLVASNSWVSNFARLSMGSYLSNSYCIGLPGQRLYGGCSFIDMIERDVIELAGELFSGGQVVCQFLSGMQANIGAYNAVLRPGDKIVTAPARHGGHYSHNADGPLRFYAPEILPVPFDPDIYNVDLKGLEELFDREKPRLIVLGWSEFPFPHPLPEIRALCDEHGVKLMYDMSHVAGLIAGGRFQPDAGPLSDVLTSSTGKSLHAPDHGILLHNDPTLKAGVLDAVMSLLTSNTHPQELAALGVALSEMKHFGADYADQVIKNSKALAAELKARGIHVLYEDLGFSESHTILVEHPHVHTAVQLLDNAGISANACPLPWNDSDTVTGIRLGTQVVTRRGMTEAQMSVVADAIFRLLEEGSAPSQVRFELILPLAREFDGVAFSFDASFGLSSDWQERPYDMGRTTDVLPLALTIPALSEASVGSVRNISLSMQRMALSPKGELFRAGAAPDAIYFVVEGSLEVVDDGGHIVACCVEGGHVGELGVMRGSGRAYTVRAAEPTVVLKLPAESFEQILRENARLSTYFHNYIRKLTDG